MKQDVEYLNYLMESFQQATGNKNELNNSSAFFKKFQEWLLVRQQILQEYIALLEDKNIDFKSSHCVEIGKGIYDTIIKEGYNTKAISPYTNGSFQKINFLIIDGHPYYIHNYGINDEKCICYSPSQNIKTFLIQNPYHQAQLSGFADLHNSGKYNIVTGVYGSINDKDKAFKISQISSVKNKLTDNDFLIEGRKTHDSYCYVLASKRRSIK